MKSNYTPSINIVRDSEKKMDYIVTENATEIVSRIITDFNNGFHSFNVIGSYGTGKSAFLWALRQSFLGNENYFDVSGLKFKNVHSVNLVGDYRSLIDAFNEQLKIDDDYASNQKLFDKLFEQYSSTGKDGLLILMIDELGKFLEYAAKNNPEKEMYFMQQLAEFANDPTRNIILISTLHQAIDSYAAGLNENHKNEWRKVKGRLKEIPFNEPIEQLLTLASKHFREAFGERKTDVYSKKLVQLQKSNYIFSADRAYFEKLENALFPLDIFSAYTLTLSLQRYGQNERSLFSFIQSSENLGIQEYVSDNKYFSIAAVYDYLLSNYYSTISGKSNPDYSNWTAIKDAIQRSEVIDDIDRKLAETLLKTIGLLQIFSSKAAKVNQEFLTTYFSVTFKADEVNKTLVRLKKAKIVRFVQFNESFKLFDGSDLDIEEALVKVGNQISEDVNILTKLEQHFEFPIVTAKAVSYTTGTPRLFEYRISNQVVFETPIDEIDGFINLIFNTELDSKSIKTVTKESSLPIVYAYFKNSEKITSALLDIEKTSQVLRNIEDDGDKVAIKELKSIRNANINLLNHYVVDALYNDKYVEWIYLGKSIKINGKKQLNQCLSKICEDVYTKTPVLKNELFNKHKVSGAISSARKNYFKALVNNYAKHDLGFDKEKFPPEKTIYYTLLEQTGIHQKKGKAYELVAPEDDTPLYKIWKASEEFLSSAKEENRPITDLINTLTKAPYKLKQGVIEFWLPTFLFMRKGDYALYSEGTFKPYINETELYLITRNPQDYEVKSFELNDLRLSFFNKYRELLQQKESSELSVTTFIESIRPILLLYKGFNDYQKNTKTISKEAIAFREVIQNAKDPESIFFDQFPKALNFDVNELLDSEKDFDDYIYKFQATIKELQQAYNELLNRFELFITSEFFSKKDEFLDYKTALTKRFKGLKEHQLSPKQKTFVQRLNSPLNDRDSWLASIGQTIIGKSLASIDDKDELILKDRFKFLITELDNLTNLDKLKVDETKEEVFKLDITTKAKGLSPHVVRISKSKIEAAKNQIASIDKELGKDKKTRIAILAKLLKAELEK